jgi:hypothetical protein
LMLSPARLAKKNHPVNAKNNCIIASAFPSINKITFKKWKSNYQTSRSCKEVKTTKSNQINPIHPVALSHLREQPVVHRVKPKKKTMVHVVPNLKMVLLAVISSRL